MEELPLENQLFNIKEGLTAVIVGAGSIGVSFALLFAKNKASVQIYEPNKERIKEVRNELKLKIKDLKDFELLDMQAEDVLLNISFIDSLSDIYKQTNIVIECAPEKLEVKQQIFNELDSLLPSESILASASSAIMMSDIAKDITNKYRCLIAHPGNPPHLIPIIEIVPAEFTNKDIIDEAKFLFESIGQCTVVLKKEIEGFIFNRLQGAILREAYCLVRDDVANVEDIDNVVKYGLGLRWSIVGPFETIDLNTRGGISSHAERMGPAYERMGRQRGQNDPWTSDLVEKVNKQRRDILPLKDWEKGVRSRDEQIMKLLKCKSVDD